MSTSNRRIEANRRNAQLSTGPRTAAGKARVAQNRTTHALTGAHTLLPGEDPQAYATLLATLFDEHAPATETEAHQVELLAHTQWKLRRAAQLEIDALVSSSRPAAEATNAGSGSSFTLTDDVMRAVRYQASIRRSYSLALAELHRLQSARRLFEQAELAQALDLQFLKQAERQAQKARNESNPTAPAAELRQSLTPLPTAKPEAPSTP